MTTTRTATIAAHNRIPPSPNGSLDAAPDIVAVNRRTIDGVLIGAGALGVVVLLVAAVLLTWIAAYIAALLVAVLVVLGVVHRRRTSQATATSTNAALS